MSVEVLVNLAVLYSLVNRGLVPKALRLASIGNFEDSLRNESFATFVVQ